MGKGVGLIVTGMLLMIGGALISASVIGAICGIPMFLAGLPLAIVGGFKVRQYQLNELKDSIRRGIVEGAQESGHARSAPQTLPPAGQLTVLEQCPQCSTYQDKGGKFCSNCGATLVEKTSSSQAQG